MSGIENILPRDRQLNESVRILRDDLITQFSNEAEDSGDVISADQEFSRPPVTIWRLSGLLADILKSKREAKKEVQGAVYRGINFGFQIADLFLEGSLESISFDAWMTDDESFTPKKMGRAMRADVQTYLAERPDIDSLIAFFMSEVSGPHYDMHNHHVETGIGLVLLLTERHHAEKYLQTRAESLTQDDILNQTRYNGSDT